MVSESRLTCTRHPDGWGIDGELDRQNAASLHTWCEGVATVQQRCTLDLGGLEILDSEGITAAIEAIRLLLQRTPALAVTHAPHLLAHALYRLGMLDTGGRLALIEPRQEEPYG